MGRTQETDPRTGRNLEALRQLRRVVEAAPDDRWNMCNWSSAAPPGCGTAHCAVGWAAIDPWFRANTRIGEIFLVEPVPGADPAEYTVTPVGCHWFEGGRWRYLADQVGELVFGLDPASARRLFGGALPIGGGPDLVPKAEVLGAIDALIAGEEIGEYRTIAER